MADVPYNGGVATVSPDASAPGDYQHISANPSSFGALIGQGEEKAGAGLTDASNAAFSLQTHYGKIAVDDQINKLMDTSDKIRRGDPTKTVTGPDGQPQPDVGYLGTTGRTALDAREPTMKALDGAIKAGRDNLTTDQQRLDYDNQSRRMRSSWTDQIGSHSDTQFKTWAASVNSAAATHALNHIAANPEGEEFAHGAADLINARVQEVQSKFGDDPQLKTEAIAKAKSEALKTQLATIGARDPSRAMEILDKNRDIAGADYAPMVEHLRGRADQQDGFAAADKLISAQGNRPYGSAAHPVYAQAAAEIPGGMSAQGLARTVQIESSGNPNAGNASDHVGLGQFSKDTAAEVGITNRNDPEQSVRGIARYAAANAPMLQKALGHAPDDADFYLAHQQGPAGASKLLANPDTRAGDLVGDKAISQNGGDPNAPASAFTGLWRSKFNQAAVATGEASPAESLAHREGALKLAVLNDPDMTARPQMQAAALNRINVTFAAQRETQANDASAFKLKLQNSTAEALDTGHVTAPLAPDEFNAALGSEEGARQYHDYQANVQLGADMRATSSMSPEQLAVMQRSYMPTPGSDDYLAQAKRADQLGKAIAQNDADMKKDPADFLVRRTDIGGEAYKRFATTMADPKASPEQRQVAAGLFAGTMKSEQARLGVPADQIKVVPGWYVSRLMDRLQQPDEKGELPPIGPQLEAEAKIWGADWPSVTRQIPKDAAPLVRVLASGVPSAPAQKLQAVQSLSIGQILKDEDTEKGNQIKKDVLDAFKPFASSLAGNAGGLSLFNDFRGQAEKLAATYVIGGKTSSDAAAQAFNDLVGAKYTFQDGYRVPKDAGVSPDIVAQGSVIALKNLGGIAPNNFAAATNELNLTPQEQALYQRHLTNLNGPGGVDNPPDAQHPQGSRSTLYQAVQEHDGKFYNIPTVWNGKIETEKWADKDGKVWDVPNKTTLANVEKEGWEKFPSYTTADEADQRYDKMHGYLEKDTDSYLRQRTSGANLSVRPATDTIGGLSPEYLQAGKIASLQRDGKWVTSPDEKGLMLVHNDQAVRRPDGSALTLTWKQLNDLAVPEIQKKDQQFKTFNRAGTFG